MAKNVEFRLYGNREVRDDLRAIAERGEDLRPLLFRFADQVLEAESAQFASGKGWRRLKASTRRWKADRGLDPRVLIATGRLRDSLTRASHPEHVREVTRDGIRVGTSVWYARFHSKSRPPVKLRPSDRRETVQMTKEYLMAPVDATAAVRWRW